MTTFQIAVCFLLILAAFFAGCLCEYLRSKPALFRCVRKPLDKGWNECARCDALWHEGTPRPTDCLERDQPT